VILQKIRNYKKHWKNWLKSGNVCRDLWDTVIYFAKAYLMLVAFIIVFQRSVMYHPAAAWRVTPDSIGAQVVTYVTTDNIKLTSWYIPPKDNKPVFVMFHGNGGNISYRSFNQSYFTSKGYGFLLAEYRGYGGNPGSISEQGFYNDGRAAMAWLMQDRKIPENRIIIYGQSVGSGTACEMALEYKGIKALVLEAPFTSAENEADDVYPWLRPFTYLTLDKFDNIAKAKYFSMPVIVLQGAQDKVIPPTHGKALFDAVASPVKKYVRLEGGHNDLAYHGLLPQIEYFISGL
jgi:fermentation-respiration switch protein FrsA (DUF1100 family)